VRATGKKQARRAVSFVTLAALATALLTLALIAAPASASKTRFLQETFGSAEQPSFGKVAAMAVDPASGDLLVVDSEADTLSRYHEDGTPSAFSALGTHVIDGANGPGDKACAEEPASCDETPQHGLDFVNFTDEEQVAIDDSGGVTDGNIYVTQSDPVPAVDIFAADGSYLGQLTHSGPTPFSNRICGVAVDEAGTVYVVDPPPGTRLSKFAPSANPPVNSDLAGKLIFVTGCPIALGVGAGTGFLFSAFETGVFKYNRSVDEGYGVLAPAQPQAQGLSVDPLTGRLFAASTSSVKEYSADGTAFVDSFGSGSFGGVASKPGAEAVYLGAGSKVDVYGPLVPFLPEVTTSAASKIGKTTATLNGTVNPDGGPVTECFFEYGTTASYGETVPCAETPAQIGSGTKPVSVHADVSGLNAETTYHYRVVAASANGDVKAPDETLVTASKPLIVGLWSQDVGIKEATIKAQINPRNAATSYRFEWGLSGAPYEHLSADVAIGSEPSPHTVSLFLSSLTPDTTYHYRVVAENEIGTSEETDHTFVTFAPTPPPDTDCPNQAFRTGPSSFLPDCRAYEMVSPVDKNGADILHGWAGAGLDPGTYVQSAPDGESLAYATLYAAFAGQPSSLKFNQYLADRGAGGWSSEGIHPPVPGHQCCEGVNFIGIYREFMAFSPDLCSAWIYDKQSPPLNADGQEDLPNLYRRDNCGEGKGELETLTTAPPPAGPLAGFYVDYNSVQGLSEDARHAFFVARAKLAPGATETGSAQIYDRFEGTNHLVSVLPGGEADPTDSRVGGDSNLDNAVSEDGSRVHWTSGSGRIYLRRHPAQGIVSGECTKATKACTFAVSGGSALFLTAAADGSRALYSEGENLREFDLAKAEAEEPPRRLIDDKVEGVTGASEDLSRIYFVSTAVLPGSGPNSEGEEAQAGEPNLYLAEGTAFEFVGTLVEEDVGAVEADGELRAYDLVSTDPFERASRVSPDGSRIVFNSRAPLTGFESTDPESGKAAVQVYTYEAGGDLTCVSCNPSGARPTGIRELPRSYNAPYEKSLPTAVPAAAWIPTWEHPLYASNVLTEDGSSIFFNSNDALIPRDTNGAPDVYQWQVAGSGDCDEEDADYFPSNGGCVHLISSGESPSESEFWEASPDGSNVFFTTASSLLPQDPGSIDLYDARVEGGFPQPSEPAACEGEACQSPPGVPNASTPSSTAFEGEGNVKEAKPRPRCPKGKRRVVRRGKARCVKRRGNAQRKANSNRRAKR
jgi:hypothetical protein